MVIFIFILNFYFYGEECGIMGIWGEIASSKATHKKLQLPHGWLQGLLSRAHSIRKCPPSASAWGWATAITTTTSLLLSTPCFLLRHFSSASGPSASTSSSHALPSNRPRNSSKRPLLAATLPRVWGGSWTPRAVMVKKMLVVAVTVTMVGWRVVTLQLKVPFWLVCCLWVLLVDLPLLGMSTGTRSMPSWLSFRASLKVICYNWLHIWFFSESLVCVLFIRVIRFGLPRGPFCSLLRIWGLTVGVLLLHGLVADKPQEKNQKLKTLKFWCGFCWLGRL